MKRLIYHGAVASPGTALGLLHHTDQPPAAAERRPAAGDAAEEVIAAFDAVASDLQELSRSLRASGQPEMADIVEANGYIALDRDLRSEAVRRTGPGQSPAHAVAEAIHEYAAMLAALEDETLAERAADVRQVGRRVLAHLAGSGSAAPNGPIVLAAHEIGAADLLEHGELVLAALSIVGGANSHASIIARSLGIPLVLGLDPAMLQAPDGTEVLVDAQQATVTVNPDEAERAAAIAAMDAARRRRELLAAERDLPCQTLDGRIVGLYANVATPVEAKAVATHRAEGVGLLRTELPFLEAPDWPTEAQHSAVLRPVFGKLTGLPVTVRTLDFADDKFPPFLASAAVDGHLGRGLPLMLAEPTVFAAQFRAILATGAASDVRIMIPMVASAAELASCRAILAEAAVAVGVESPPLGVMIELPQAVAVADELASDAAFFSIGSNDLTCQILGVDRRSPDATPEMAAHPAVLSAIAATVAAAHRHDKPVSVCGDAAAHPLVVPLLIGLGCDSLSVAPSALDEVRALIRRLDAALCVELADKALMCATPQDVWRLVRDA